MKMNGISIIGTLGNSSDDVTCSVLAAKSLGEAFTIAAFGEFELAADFLLSNNIDAMLVPGAYPSISKFIMNEQLVVKDVFTYVIPPLVLASKYMKLRSKYDILFNHSATNPLVKDICNTKWSKQQNVSSNTEACLEAVKSEYACCAITNAACAEKYGLLIHQVIRASINMPFVVFTRKKEGSNYES